MRSLMVCTVVGLAVMTMAASSSAQDPIKVGPIGSLELAPAVHVTGFHRYGQTGAYTGGAIGMGVDVVNDSDKPADNVSVKLDMGGGKVVEQVVSIPAKGTRMATFFDNDGLSSSCKPSQYKIMLSGPGTGTNGSVRNAAITPSCTFQSKLEESWNLMSPDRVEDLKTGHAYLSSPALTIGASCGTPPTVKVKIINKSSLSSPSVIVQAKETATNQVRSQTSAAFPLASSEYKDLTLTPVLANASGEPTARLHLGIVDWTKSLQGKTSDGGIYINTTRSCSLAFALQ